MSSKIVEYFFDYSCPYAYLGSTQIEALCARNGATLRWRPMLLGGLFQALGVAQNQAQTMSPPKARHNLADMKRWASLWEVPLSMPAAHPMRTVLALRATLAAPEEKRPSIIHAIFRAYWVENVDISDPEVLRGVLDRAGQDGGAILGAIDQKIKDELRANTDEALKRGAFGAPSVFVGEELFWGQDRLFMVEKALGGTPRLPGEGASRPAGPPPTVDFWFDFSSPFAYLGSTQIEAVCKRNGAVLRPRPMFLGGVFKALGGPLVPFGTFSPAKQQYVGTDLGRWARHWEVPFQWPSRFPMMTVKALRIALSLGEEMLPFVHACFRAYWVEDRDINDEETLRALLQQVGQDPARLSAANDPAWKNALAEATQTAVDQGVFGAPTMICNGEALFWGQDRLSLVERFLQGWRPPA